MKELISLSEFTTTAGSGRTLERIAPERMDQRGFLPGANPPTHYAQYRDWIELWPSPSSAFSLHIRYRSHATDMLAGSQVPSMSTPWRKGILYLSEAFLHEYVGNYEEGAASRARYFVYVSALKTDKARRDASTANFRISMPFKNRRFASGLS